MILVYIAGLYSAKTHSEIDDNIRKAEKAAVKLWGEGYAVMCPHLNSAHFERYSQLTYDMFMSGYLDILSRCDALYLLKGWQNSEGAKKERKLARELELEVFYE